MQTSNASAYDTDVLPAVMRNVHDELLCFYRVLRWSIKIMHYKMTIAAEGLVTIASSIGFGAAFTSVGASERTGMATNPLMMRIF